MAAGISKEMEIKLTNVARASLEELLVDYRDFLRAGGFAEWPADHTHMARLRQLNRIPDATYETFRKGIESPDPTIAANVILGLIRVGGQPVTQPLTRPPATSPPDRGAWRGGPADSRRAGQ
jgi:hypothetical protein